MITLNVLKTNLPVKGGLRTDRRSDNWDALEIKFPDDYREFISYYGEGDLESSRRNPIFIFSPFSSSWISFFESGIDCLQECEEFEMGQLAMYPSPGGCLPCAKGNGVFIFWITKGSPNEWILGLHDITLNGFRSYNMTFLEFLNNLVTDPDFSDVLADFSNNPYFRPNRWY
jgi:hypothetical protein